jgi:linoleoyl-CoA desaturase
MTQSNEIPGGAAIAAVTDDHTCPKLKFSRSDRFLRELRKRVDDYFEQSGRPKRDCPQMYFKTAVIMTWFVAAYLLLVFVVASWWTIIPLAIVMGFAVAAVGFNIQHDGGHKAYSKHKWVNKLMGLTIELVGGSSYLWDWKHNAIHHTYTNINGHDDDINVGFLGRLSPEQPRHAFHRFQGIYLWVLYGFLTIKWHFFDDFYNVALGRIGGHKVPRPRGRDLLVFIGGKVLFFSLAIGIPMLMHKWWAVLMVFALVEFVSGVVLSVVFQLAHCVEEAAFPVPLPTPEGGLRMENEWAVHEVQTTVDFSHRNPLARWFLGGLNFQIEHHLFSKICHTNYVRIAKVVEETCREFGVKYTAQRSFFGALRSHYRFLTAMGRPIEQSAA